MILGAKVGVPAFPPYGGFGNAFTLRPGGKGQEPAWELGGTTGNDLRERCEAKSWERPRERLIRHPE